MVGDEAARRSEARTLLWITLVRFESSPRELQSRNLHDGVVIYESEETKG